MTAEYLKDKLAKLKEEMSLDFMGNIIEPYEGEVLLRDTKEQLDKRNEKKKVWFFADDGHGTRWFYDTERSVYGEAVYGDMFSMQLPQTTGRYV